MNTYTFEAYTYFKGNITPYNRLQAEVLENQKDFHSDAKIDVIKLYYPIEYYHNIEDSESKAILEDLLEYFSQERLDDFLEAWIPAEGDLLVYKDGVILYRIDIEGYYSDEWEAECEAEGLTHIDTEADFI